MHGTMIDQGGCEGGDDGQCHQSGHHVEQQSRQLFDTETVTSRLAGNVACVHFFVVAFHPVDHVLDSLLSAATGRVSPFGAQRHEIPGHSCSAANATAAAFISGQEEGAAFHCADAMFHAFCLLGCACHAQTAAMFILCCAVYCGLPSLPTGMTCSRPAICHPTNIIRPISYEFRPQIP